MSGFVTIPIEKPFLESLAAYILRRYGADPVSLSQVVVLLPTRRACRSLRDILLKSSNARAMLLPRLQPVGDVEEESFFDLHSLGDHAGEIEAAIPAVIPPLKRQMLLARLVAKFEGEQPHNPYSIVQHMSLGTELARFFDNAEREELDFSQLKHLVPERFAAHWQQTLRFLEIVTHFWPELLRENHAEDPVRRRNSLILRLAEHWQVYPPSMPIIVAGSTGSQPATAKLLKAVAELPQGLVVLPGFDNAMTEEAWEMLDETHPQYLFKILFARVGVQRQDIGVLDPPDVAASCGNARICLLRESLKPPDLTHAWRNCDIQLTDSLVGVRRIDADSLQDEARLIGIMLREVLETPGKTAAVVTKDRTLARMVTAMMERYGVAIDDSAGKPLSETTAGHFLRLVADCALARAAPVPLLAMLKHPLASCGMLMQDFRSITQHIEILVLRGPRLAPGLPAIAAHLAYQQAPAELIAWVERLHKAAEGFFDCFARRTVSFSHLLRAHLAFAEFLAADDVRTGAERLWAEDEAEEVARYMANLLEHADTLGAIDPGAYPAVIAEFLKAEVYRPRYGTHPRLHIYSPQEARLERVDVMIIAGLNEGVWPPQADASPWMSRPMQKQFGLPAPELAVGRAAHDFLMISGAREIVLTRAEKTDGAPTVPSRWLLRMDTLLQALSADQLFNWPQTPYAAWLLNMEAPIALPPFKPPAPCPPLSARPRRLSVTRIETWQRDPYAIYASAILKLHALPPLDQEPDAASFGTLIHRALEAFISAYPHALPQQPYLALVECGRKLFLPLWDQPAVRGFWWPRFKAIAEWVAAQELERRPQLASVAAEYSGELRLPTPAGSFTLTTRIDRVEVMRAGAMCMIDYKTGTVPTDADIASGISSQMPLEALIVEKGMLTPPLQTRNLERAEYWKLKGECALNAVKGVGEGKNKPLRELIDRAEEGVMRLIAAFEDADTPYLACPDPRIRPRYNDYEYLERLGEWAVA